MNIGVSEGSIMLSPAEVHSLTEFFLLLNQWDRMSTAVTEQAAAQEQTAA